MGVNSLPSAWRSNIHTGQVQTRDLRLYLDPRGIEYPDLETGAAVYTLAREDNLIDRGNCESVTAPMMFGETVPVLLNATFAQSTDFAHGGDSSFKVTKTIAAGTDARVTICDSTASGDMHGLVAGESYEFSKWVYIPTASGILGTEISYVLYRETAAGGFVATTIATATNTYDAWQKLSGSFTLADNIIGCFLRIFVASAAALNEYFYVDDFRLSSHTVPGSHYLSSGYVETLCPLTETGTFQIGFIPTYAYNTGSNQPVISFYVSATQYFEIYYSQTADMFTAYWIDGGTGRYLQSAQYDNGTAFRNINQKLVLTFAYDLSTGDTTGASLWMDKTQDDTTWSGNIDAKVTEFNKMQIRAHAGTAGAHNVLFVRYFPNLVATNAQVQNDFQTVANEEIFWSLDGHGTGKTRCNISPFFVNYNIYKGVTSKVSDSHGTNILGITLKSLQGEFADDQYAAFTPTSYQYNGTAAQNYLSRRMGISLESWYSGDFEHVFVGRLTEQGLQRASYNHNQSYVSGTVEDGVGDIDRTFETNGRKYESYDICDPANEGDSLIHTIAHLADRNNKQYLANNSFENATIGNRGLSRQAVRSTEMRLTGISGRVPASSSRARRLNRHIRPLRLPGKQS